MKNKILNNSIVYLCVLPFLMSLGGAQTLEAKDSYMGGGEGGAQSTTLIDTGVGLKDGKVWVWGYKDSGQQGNGASNGNKDDRYRKPEQVNSLENIVLVSGGAYHMLAVDNEGNAWGWGLNALGPAGCVNPIGKTIISKPCPIVGTDGKRLILQSAMAAGEYNSIFLDTKGNVLTAGNSTFGQLGRGKPLRNIFVPEKINLKGEIARLIGASYEGGFAVTYDGASWDPNSQNVWVWGRNMWHSLGIDEAGAYPARLDQWLDVPKKAPELKPYAHRMVKIAGGYQYGVALLNDGKLIGWGFYGSLGQSCSMTGQNTTKSARPVEIKFPPKLINGKVVETKIVQVETRFESTIVLTNHNDIYTFGTLTSRSGAYKNIQGWCPKLANIPEKFRQEHGHIVKVGAGKHHITYEMSDGSTWGVGYNAGGQIWFGLGFIDDFPGQRLRDLK